MIGILKLKKVKWWTCVLVWLVGMYFLWIDPLLDFVFDTILIPYGCFGPFGGTSEGHLWWLDYWLGEEVYISINLPGFIFTLFITVGWSWVIFCHFQSCVYFRPLTYSWRGMRGELRSRKGLCPACAYDLKLQSVDGCPECGWGRVD